MANKSDLKRLAAAAFTRQELEYLLSQPAFRTAYDSGVNTDEAFEELCVIGSFCLSVRDGYIPSLKCESGGG